MSTKARKKSKSKPDLKVVLVGDANVGKTSLLLRYFQRKFITSNNTVGVSFLLKQWRGQSIALWDTAGTERYCGLGSLYFRSASAVILVYDLTSETSFEVLKTRFIPILTSAPSDCLIVVVGTKLDLVLSSGTNVKKVSSEKGHLLAACLNSHLMPGMQVPYFETSSVTGYNVDRAFESIFEYFFPANHKDAPKLSKTQTDGALTLELQNDGNHRRAGACCES